MSRNAGEILDFVAHIPATTNPFQATALMVDNLISPPPSSTWSRTLTMLALAAFVIMLFQSGVLLCQRIKIGKFSTLKINELGLFVLDLSDVLGLLLCIYSSLTIACLLMRIAAEYGTPIVDSPLLILFGCKFLALTTCSWAFVWTCSCHCAILIWESDIAAKMNREKLKATLKWGMSIFCLVAVLLPFPLVIWAYASAYHDYLMICRIVRNIHKTLLSAASTYEKSQTHQITKLLRLLLPARKVAHYLPQMEYHVLMGIRFYGISLSTLVMLYNPLLFFSLRNLYKRSLSQSALDAACGKSEQSFRPKRKVHQERRRQVYHAFIVYCSTVVHLPIIFWQLFNSPDGFLRDPKWLQMTYHGLTVPFSITGNILLVILNLHSRNVLLEMKANVKGVFSGSCTGRLNSNIAGNAANAAPGPCWREANVELDTISRRKSIDACDIGTTQCEGPIGNKPSKKWGFHKIWSFWTTPAAVERKKRAASTFRRSTVTQDPFAGVEIIQTVTQYSF